MKEDKAVGNDIEASEDEDVSDEEKDILKKQFRAADFDSNKLLSQSEITMAISRETKQHILVGSQQTGENLNDIYSFLVCNEE